MSKFASISTVYNNLLRPDPAYVTNEKDVLLAFVKNKFIFWMYILFWLMNVGHISQLGLDPWKNEVLWIMAIIYITFITFCRTYPFFTYKLYSILLLSANMIHYSCNSDKLDGAWPQILINPILVYYISNSRLLPFVSIMIETYLLKNYYVPYIVNSEENMEVFKRDLLRSLVSIGLILYLITWGADSQLTAFQKAYIETNIKREELEKHKVLVLSFSHEIRNLINSLNGIIQLCVIEGNPTPIIQNYLKEGKYCTDFLIHLMNNVLDSGKISINDLEFTSTKTSIYETLSESWGLASQLIKKKWITGSIKIAKNVPDQLIIDKYRIGQIILNLIGNAVKFTDRGRVDVIVDYIPDQHIISNKTFLPDPYYQEDEYDEATFSKDINVGRFNQNYHTFFIGQPIKYIPNNSLSGKGILKISVQDTGVGIAPQDIPKLFKQFSQVHSGYKKQIGTGLGLYITKKLCEGMNGDVKVFSKLGHGSTFVVCLVTEAVEVVQEVQAQPQRIEKRSEINAMIVDDESFARNVLSQFLQKLKIKNSLQGIDGNDGYQKYKEAHGRGVPVNFITMDINMPGCDGKSAVKLIRKYEIENKMEPAVVVFISGNCLQSEIEECLRPDGEIRADHFLKKPVGLEEIYKAIQQSFGTLVDYSRLCL